MNKRQIITLLAFVAWVAITVLGGKLLGDGQHHPLIDTVSHGLAWNIVAAAIFIYVVNRWQGWGDTGLVRPHWASSIRLAWLPLLYIAIGMGFSIILGLPPVTVMFWLALNTLFVGFSEELMFRGVILQTARQHTCVWPAILITSLAFGGIHSLNVFGTGDLRGALVQSAAAFLSGLIFIALRLRTGSLWPSIALHALWDFATFTMSASHSVQAGSNAGTPPSQQVYLPLLLVLPNALYALWLLRHAGRYKKQAA